MPRWIKSTDVNERPNWLMCALMCAITFITLMATH